MKTKFNISIMCLFFLFWGILYSSAQVTIGSGIEPHSSALLDLKQNADGTSTKGF